MRQTFDQDGVTVVRHFLEKELYGNEESADAMTWLAEKEREREANERKVINAAQRSNLLAIIAVIIALVALGFQVFG